MKSKNKILKFIYKLLINVAVNYLFIMLILNALEVDNNTIFTLIIIGASILSVCFWRLILKKPLSILGIMIISTLIIAYMNYYQNDIYYQAIQKFSDFVNWSYRYIYGMTFYHEFFIRVLLVVIVFVLSIITSTFIFRKKGALILLVAGTVVFLIRWFQYSDSAMIYGIFYIFIMLMLHTFNRFLRKEELWEEKQKIIKTNILRNWIIYSILICVVVVSIATILPRNFSPITWRWLDKKLQGEFTHFADWRNNRKTSFGYGNKMKFDLSLTGFQQDYKRLGGPVSKNDTLIMVVDSNEPVYLKGRVKDYYTGSFWKSTENAYSEELKGIPNSLYENSRFASKDGELEGEPIRFTITHKNVVTSTLFNSYFPKTFIFDSSFYYITDERETFAKQLILKDKSYTYIGVKPYVDWNKLRESKYVSKEGYEKYLQLPDTITSRVDELSYELTRGLKSDYSKVKSIEQYLRNNFEYKLTPPETPYNKDFVDYFLFDLKEGYCTYYASSLVVMSRIAGIPARYVEGFKASYENVDNNGNYLVYGSNAHAWAEVYIEGYGWMIFEATPPFSNVYYEEKEKEKEETEEVENNREQLNSMEGDLRGLEDPNMMEEIVEGGELDFEELESNDIQIVKILGYILLLVLSLFFLRILYNIFRIKRIHRKMKLKSLRERVLEYYRYIMNLFDRIDRGKGDNETVSEYSNRLNLDIWEVEHKFNEVTNIFNKARYSNEFITETEVEEMKEYFLKTEKNIRNKIGRLRFIMFKYFLLGMFK